MLIWARLTCASIIEGNAMEIGCLEGPYIFNGNWGRLFAIDPRF
jgi:hypothetical protein